MRRVGRAVAAAFGWVVACAVGCLALLLIWAGIAGAVVYHDTYYLTGDGSSQVALNDNHLVVRRLAGGACCTTLGYPIDAYLPWFCLFNRVDNGNGSGPALIWLTAPLGYNCWPGYDQTGWYGWTNGYGYYEGQSYTQGWAVRRAWGTGTVIEVW